MGGTELTIEIYSACLFLLVCPYLLMFLKAKLLFFDSFIV